MKTICSILLFVCFVSANPRRNWQPNAVFQAGKITKKGVCGYEGCPKIKPDMINVHLVPHSHDDVGWLKTIDEYYYGSQSRIQKAGVQYILDSVVQELLKNPERRFVYAESAFFFKWWDEQSDLIKSQTKMLIEEGRFEFIGGAWTMNDEAAVHYHSVIDQFTWGLRKLNQTFGECGRPKIGWQIDPFGHSREMASMLAQIGFDGIFFARADHADKSKRLRNKEAEFIWHGSSNLDGDTAKIFTSLLFNHYSPPPGFCFDYLCSDEPIIDGRNSPDNNVERKVNAFTTFIQDMADKFRTNNLIITMGDDFHYQSANMWYSNLDKLITYTNEQEKINLIYSTPSCYVKAVHEANISWPIKTDDFFPYSSDPHAFWTGYFTSRPNQKRFEREGNSFLQVCKQLSMLSPQKLRNFDENLALLKSSMGIMQHHDAITGTEKQHVSDDYNRIHYKAIDACAKNVKFALNQLKSQHIIEQHKIRHQHQRFNGVEALEFELCHNLNISQCDISENSNRFIATVYNPLGRSVNQYVRIPVVNGAYLVRDNKGKSIPSQLVPISETIQDLHYRISLADYELVFLAEELPPIGYRSYFISKENHIQRMEPINSAELEKEDFSINNKLVKLKFNGKGQLKEIEANGVSSAFDQQFYYYEGALGNNGEWLNRSSGAYIFRPNSTEKLMSENVKFKVVKGSLVQEVHQVFSDWLSQVIRLYEHENFIEFDWLVGEIPIGDSIGKEVITRFSADIDSKGTFETDSNGREMLPRIRNYRPTWDIDLQEPIAGNYYPVTAKIAIDDGRTRLAVLNDRAQGGSSIKDGTVELMVHRRLLHDDAFGVGEALNETAYGKGIIARGRHYVSFGSASGIINSQKAQERQIQLEKMMQSWTFFSDAKNIDFENWKNNYVNTFSGISKPLPKNVNLMTLEQWDHDSILVRFEHILEKGEDEVLSTLTIFNIKEIFANFNIVNIRETTLAANQWKDKATRFHFNELNPYEIPTEEYKKEPIELLIRLDITKNEFNNSHQHLNRRQRNSPTVIQSAENDKYLITLQPMEIRTFVLYLQK